MKIIRSKAPLRLGLAGGGTDISLYSEKYTGNVLNATISLYAHCTIKETDNDLITIFSQDYNIKETFSAASKIFKLNGKLDLIKQILNHLIANKYVDHFPSFSMYTICDAPPGTGLGSSSTLVVSVIKAFVEWLKLPLGEYDIAEMAYQVERNELSISGGKQDQYAATFGGFNFIEFKKNERVIVNPLRLKRWIINELESSILIFNIGTSRFSSKIIEDQKKSISNNLDVLESLHLIKKSAILMKESILFGDFKKIIEIFRDSWDNKKKLSSSISNSHINKIYDIAIENGANAGKISGAGGGGVIVLMIDSKMKKNIIDKLTAVGCKHINFVFTSGGCKGWTLNN